MCSLGLPISIVEFETMTVEEQIQAVSSSTVMLAAHGAGMSHAAWMRPGAAVVEVLMRQGFAGSDYHKADFGTCALCFL
jgi:capsular polysaccharide biosynthesis protein